jgi:hypothetical protein
MAARLEYLESDVASLYRNEILRQLFDPFGQSNIPVFGLAAAGLMKHIFIAKAQKLAENIAPLGAKAL